ncbi:MAG: DNA/RNA nuclease SfsA [Pseudomonadales bacterium]|nr:DNA/RNA nuclease SfsA [Pseudomonadales bacterium]
MKYSPSLEEGILIKRYKRFLADIETADGKLMTIHCPNTGAMTNCAEAGDKVYYSKSDNPKRKYAYTWELSRTKQGHFIGINSAKANHIVREAVESGQIDELGPINNIEAEVAYGRERSRIDLLLHTSEQPDCYVEIKSVTLLDETFGQGCGFFPDAVSERGRKHLRELSEQKQLGNRAIIFFCVQHSGIKNVAIAGHIDPEYKKEFDRALEAGVEVIVYQCAMSPNENKMCSSLEFRMNGASL